jgi:hypothetical protein
VSRATALSPSAQTGQRRRIRETTKKPFATPSGQRSAFAYLDHAPVVDFTGQLKLTEYGIDPAAHRPRAKR